MCSRTSAESPTDHAGFEGRNAEFESLIPFPESSQVTPVIDRTFASANVPMPWVTSRPDSRGVCHHPRTRVRPHSNRRPQVPYQQGVEPE